jgi:hypothetical protein
MPDHDESILEKAFRYAGHHGLEGDYLEFGVWKGRTFTKAYHLWRTLFSRKGVLKDMRFWAFDSFQGLPDITHEADRSTGEFKKGDYAFSRQEFERRLRSNDIDMERVCMVPGWYNESLLAMASMGNGPHKAAIVLIDCDLYKSTLPVLSFLTNVLQDGTVLIFDDWFAFRGHPDKGEQKAFSEWLKQHPNWTSTEWQVTNWRTKAFIMNRNV